jgi:Type IV secretory system Conjugative DNA transfer
LILTDINQGLGVCLIEPHGDLTKTVLSCIPEGRLHDVVLLDPMDSDYPFGLNIFECRDVTDINEVAKTSSFVFHVFEKMWGVGPNTPRLAQVLRNVTQTLIDNPGTTFGEIPFLFWNERARGQLVANVKNQQAQLFCERYAQRSRRDREEYVESTDNKVDAYLGNDKIRYIVSQAKTTVDFRTIMDEGKILLILLSPQLEEISRLIGSVIIGKLLMAAFSRVDTDEDKRRQFNLYCDEYQRFATSDFRSFIDEARKFKIAITLSHQTLSQLDEENRTAAAGAANMIAFRVSGEDGKELAKNFDTTPTQAVVGEEPIRAPVSDVIIHLVNKGHNDERVTRFAQRYLQRLEDFVDKKYDHYPPQNNLYDATYITGADIRKGREV